MTGLPMDFSDVLSEFDSPAPVVAYETTGSREANAGWRESPQGADRAINAIVLNLSAEELELLNPTAPGEFMKGGIAITTADTLYFRGPNSTGVESTQSYVKYQGFTWRVIGFGLSTAPNASFNVYNAIRMTSLGSTVGNNP